MVARIPRVICTDSNVRRAHLVATFNALVEVDSGDKRNKRRFRLIGCLP